MAKNDEPSFAESAIMATPIITITLFMSNMT